MPTFTTEILCRYAPLCQESLNTKIENKSISSIYEANGEGLDSPTPKLWALVALLLITIV